MLTQIGLPSLTTSTGTVVSVTPVEAELLAVYVASNALGTVTLSTVAPAPVTFLTLDTAGTAWFYPRVPINTAGTAAGTILLSGQYVEIPLQGYVQVAQNAAGTVNVTLVVEM
jgi:hypothetical protein